MNTEKQIKKIEIYLGQLTQEGDKNTQFYDVCVVALEALREVRRSLTRKIEALPKMMDTNESDIAKLGLTDFVIRSKQEKNIPDEHLVTGIQAADWIQEILLAKFEAASALKDRELEEMKLVVKNLKDNCRTLYQEGATAMDIYNQVINTLS